MTTSDAASILYPSDVPAKQPAAPDWFANQVNAAEQRLSGSQKRDDMAARLFPDEVKLEPKVEDPLTKADDPAAALYKNDGKDGTDQFDDTGANSFFDQQGLTAIQQGDKERAQEIVAAKDALISDMRAAGTDHGEFDEALQIVGERANPLFAPTPEVIAAEFASSMATMQAELGPGYVSDLDAARAFIRDLETVAPGTIASLNHSGAGNDPRMIRKAVKEARRRGYR